MDRNFIPWLSCLSTFAHILPPKDGKGWCDMAALVSLTFRFQFYHPSLFMSMRNKEMNAWDIVSVFSGSYDCEMLHIVAPRTLRNECLMIRFMEMLQDSETKCISRHSDICSYVWTCT